MLFQLFAEAGFLITPSASAQSVIYSNEEFGTYYYDIEQVDACGTTFKDPNSGGVMCSSATILSLDQMNTNPYVAMNNTRQEKFPGCTAVKK